MPILIDDPMAAPAIGAMGFTGPAEPDPFKPAATIAQVAQAAFRQENDMVAVARLLGRSSYEADPSFNPMSVVKGTRYENEHLDNFLGARNEQEARDIMARIDREEADRKLLADSGVSGFALMLAAGLASPTNFIPLGGVVRAARGGFSAGRSAVSLGLAAGASVALQEGVLQAEQETRTAGDTIAAIGTATILGGLIGAGAASLLTRSEYRAIERALDQDFPAQRRPAYVMPDNIELVPHSDGGRAQLFRIKGLTNGVEDGAGAPGIGIFNDGSSIKVLGSYLAEADRGKGLGLYMYRNLAEYADSIGLPLRSDDNVSPQAAAVYRKLKGLGWDVVETPHRERFGKLVADNGEYVFEVRRQANVVQRGFAEAMGLDRSAGAAAADTRDVKLVGYGIRQLPGFKQAAEASPAVNLALEKAGAPFAWLTEKLSPNLRVLNSPNVEARRAYADLVETALRFEGGADGATPTLNGQVPVSRVVADGKARMRLQTMDIVTQEFADYRGTGVGMADSLNTAVGDALGRNGDQLTHGDFKREITRALFSGDVSPVPQVQKAAQRIRDELLEPMRQQLVDAKMLDPDVAPKGDASWFFRDWNRKALVERRPDFIKTTTDWLEAEQTRKAGAQARIDDLAAQLEDLDAAASRLDAMEQRLGLRQAKEAGAAAERGMEARRAGARSDVLNARLADQQQVESDIAEFIAAMRQRDIPAMRERVNMLDAEYRRLKKLEERQTLNEADLDGAMVQQFNLAMRNSDETRLLSRVLMGNARPTFERDILSFVARNGGIRDDVLTGELKILSEGAPVGLLNRTGRTVDQWGEWMAQQAGYERAEAIWGPSARPTPAEVLDILAMRRNLPDYLRESINTAETLRKVEMEQRIWDYVTDLSERGIIDMPADKRQVMRLLTDMDPDALPPVGPREAPGIAAGAERDAIGASLEQGRADLQQMLRAAKRAMQQRGVGEKVAKAAAGEAGMAADVSAKRLAVLQERQKISADKAQLIADARRLHTEAEADLMAKIEGELKEWGGRSADDALSAIKARDKAAVGRDPSLPRLQGADKPMLRSVRRILDSDQAWTRQELEARANEITNRLIGSPAGRLPYDVASAGKAMQAPDRADMGQLRTALRSRDFAIPTNLVFDFIEHDVEHLMGTIGRTVLPDLELVKRHGDVDMTVPLKKIEDEYARLAAEAKSEKERIALDKRKDADMRDLIAQRDRIRGVYGLTATATGENMARFARAAMAMSSMAHLGTAALNSLPDLANTIARHGLENTFRAGYQPFLQGLMGAGDVRALQKQQAKAALIAVETQLNLRSHAIADVLDNYQPGTRWERGIQWASDKFQLANFQAPWTDFAKSIASGVAADSFLASAERVALGTASKKDLAKLAEAYIDPAMATKIHEAFSKGGGEVIDGVRLPNSSTWADVRAREAFESALRREADIAVVTPGLEKPLVMSTPLGAMLLQFKSFVAAANERMLIAGLQRADAQVLQGLVAAVGLGMISYRLYTLVTGQPASEKPADWVKEGLNRSGFTGWFEEVNSTAAKASQGRVDMYRLIGAEKPMSRNQSRTAFQQMLGPVAGMGQKAWDVSGAIAGGQWDANTTTQVRRLLPLQNVFYLRQLLDKVEGEVNETFGIAPKPPRQPQPTTFQ